LAETRDQSGTPQDTALILAHASDFASLDSTVSKTRIVFRTAEAYQLHGSEVAAVCTQTRENYFDLCGEPTWMRRMIELNELNEG
jgi:short subunit dehydrogenase-like uncharacterized protein